jgi:hypothetical protein
MKAFPPPDVDRSLTVAAQNGSLTLAAPRAFQSRDREGAVMLAKPSTGIAV